MSFTRLTGIKRSNQANKESFLNVNFPQVIFYQGKRGAGKDVVLEKSLTTCFEAGITCAHLWAARNNENSFFAFNNRCESKWIYTMHLLNFLAKQPKGIIDKTTLMKEMDMHNDEMFNFYINEYIDNEWIKTNKELIALTTTGYKITQDEPLHCYCKSSYPILFIVPQYVTISQESVDKFNTEYFWDYKEYQETYLKGLVNDPVSKDTNFWKLPKPPSMQKEIFKVAKFTVPTASKHDIFVDQFAKILQQARSEHRIIVQNPVNFNGTDKFLTLAAEINSLPEITKKYFQEPTEEEIGKPRYQWNKYQKSWSKLFCALSELKTIAPSQKLSGEAKSTDTKRALFDKLSEARHFKLSIHGSYQNPEDLFPAIRYQSDYIVIKRASKNLLGDDFIWLFADIEEKRKETYRRYGVSDELIKNKPWEINNEIHLAVSKKYPRIQNLPDNMMIVTDIDNSWYYMKVPHNNHHHKHTLQSFFDVFRIDIKLIDDETGTELRPRDVAKEAEYDEDEDAPKSTKKADKIKLIERMDYLVQTKKMGFPAIAKEITGEAKWSTMSKAEQNKEKKRLWTMHNRWLEETLNEAHLK